MTQTIRGEFDVKLPALSVDGLPADSRFARRKIEKQFHGELAAQSQGEMLSHSTATPGSAGYVALEQVQGSLQGRRGSFVLLHIGRMNRGSASLEVTVVPDSGTDELTGLSGRMNIEIAGGKHFYVFEYSLANT